MTRNIGTLIFYVMASGGLSVLDEKLYLMSIKQYMVHIKNLTESQENYILIIIVHYNYKFQS